MSLNTPIHTNEHSIDRVLRTGLPTLLVFWRKGCAPCAQLDPALQRLAESFAGRALIARVNVEDNAALVQRYHVTQLPGLVLIKDGEPVAQGSGAAPESTLRAWLQYLSQGGSRPPLPSGPAEPLAGRAPGRNGQAGTPRPGAATTERRIQPATGGPAGAPLIIDDTSFDKVISGATQPVLVDFWASWCGPCRAVAPTIEQLAHEFAGRALVAKLNVDENPRTAQRFGITSIPALYIFKGGQVVERLLGAQPASVLRQALARHVSPAS